ncbi:MAG: Immune inhibitor A precursor [Elusimicrobia bacterium ADurb.Bin231]|nr:MAG: Immune inhibitor A precursor [Elusimicrobia bacterium ADurb.Bin231]
MPDILHSVPHINGKFPGPKEYSRRIPNITRLKQSGLTTFEVEKAMGASGTHKIAVILVNFASAGSNTTGANANVMTSADITGFKTTFNYVKNFYIEASYGKLIFDFTFFFKDSAGDVKSTATLTGTETPFTLQKSMSEYGTGDEYGNAVGLENLINDSITGVGSSVKHKDSGGIYDGVVIAHAGYGNESTGNSGDIWSAYIGSINNPKNGFSDGTVVPAKENGASPIGVVCHEFGHYLGLCDLYSTNNSGGSTKVGIWSLMDAGPWLNGGASPSHPNGWEKYLLGWLAPIELNSSSHINKTSYAFETSSSTVYKLSCIGSSSEYFIVYHTSRTAYSPSTPANGLLIWHIDEGYIDGITFESRKQGNTLNNYSHKTVDLEEADDSDPSANDGDTGDVWPGKRGIFTMPYSNKYDGQSSGVTVMDISASVDKSVFSVYFKPFLNGYIRNSAGAGLAGVDVKLISSTGSVISSIKTTDSEGYYVFPNLDYGSYTVIPSTDLGWHFFPESRQIILAETDLVYTALDFTGLIETSRNRVLAKEKILMPVNNVFHPGETACTIYYKVPRSGRVIIKLYTLDGRLVNTLVDEYTNPGTYSVPWTGNNDSNSFVASGIYLVHIDAAGYKDTKKICVVK